MALTGGCVSVSRSCSRNKPIQKSNSEGTVSADTTNDTAEKTKGGDCHDAGRKDKQRGLEKKQMNLASCCRHLLHRYNNRHRAVICKSWILPLRVAVVLSLFGHLSWRVFHPVAFYTMAIIIIHSTIALFLLAECRRSEQYHRVIDEFSRREAALEDSIP